MNSNTIAKGILKAVFSMLALLVLGYFLFKIQAIIIYLIIAIILALIANPVVEFLRKKLKFSNNSAVVTTLFLFIVILLGLFAMFVPLILSQGENLSLLNTKNIENQINSLYVEISNYLINHNINLKSIIKESELTKRLNFTFFTDFFNTILSSISNFGIGLVAVFFITFFFLKDKVKFLAGSKRIMPNEHEEQIINSLNKTRDLLTRYFIGLLIQLTIVCVLYLIVLLIFGVENAFIIAFLCAILNIIPYVGPLIASVLAALLTMLSNIGTDFQTEILPKTIYVLIGFFIVQLIDNNFSQPVIFSKSVKSHPLEIFLIILIAGTLFGIVGMIIAVPVFTIIKVIAKEFFPENKVVKIVTKEI